MVGDSNPSGRANRVSGNQSLGGVGANRLVPQPGGCVRLAKLCRAHWVCRLDWASPWRRVEPLLGSAANGRALLLKTMNAAFVIGIGILGLVASFVVGRQKTLVMC